MFNPTVSSASRCRSAHSVSPPSSPTRPVQSSCPDTGSTVSPVGSGAYSLLQIL